MRRLFIAALLATLGVPATALAQTEARGDASSSARIEAAIRSAADLGLPTRALEQRAAEGRAKLVAEERIAAAVETRLEALIVAREALEINGAAPDAAALEAAAFAAEAGASLDAIARAHASAPPEQRAQAVFVLGRLVAEGHGSAQALAALEAAQLKVGAGSGAQIDLAGIRAGAGPGVQLGARAAARAKLRVGGN
ncbi:MAG: hypothetical protein ACRELD_15315 [Longimicrobiales bacterium]